MDPNVSDITLTLLDSLYEAATQPAMWAVFLRKAAEAMQADKAAILLHSPGNEHTSVYADLGVSEEMRRDTEEMTKFSPWVAEIQKHRGRGWYSGCPEDLMPLESIRKSRYYNEFFCKHNIEWTVSAVIFHCRGVVPSLALARPKSDKPFGDSEKKVIRQLVPHLGRAFKVHGKIDSLNNKNDAGQHALDLIGAACVTLDGSSRVLSMNRRAEVLMANGAALHIKDHRLAASLAVEQSFLDSCVAAACNCGTGKSPNPGVGALVLHSWQGTPLYVSVLPYHSSWSPLERSPAALVFVTTQEEQGRGEHRLWQSMFALSPAECRVAEMMKQGMEVSEISDAIRIKVDTVRYYQKCVYRKTGVRGQGQLLRLLTRLPSTCP